jgi:hypothetical protein
MNQTNALIAFSFFLLLICTLTGLQALLEVFEGMIELIAFLEVNCNNLVNPYEFLGYSFF